MIVKDLLYQCDVCDVAEAWIKKGYDEVTPSRTYETLHELISELKSRQPVIGNYVVLGIEYAYDESEIIATVFDIDEINDTFKIYPEIESASDDETDTSKIEHIIEYVKLPIPCAYELTEWNEILGFGMDEQNAEKCGKANLLADILFEMTFFGFDENKVIKAREEVMVEFEVPKSFPAEEHIENLILKEKSEEPSEEKGNTREQFLREEFKTLQNQYFTLRDYKGIG